MMAVCHGHHTRADRRCRARSAVTSKYATHGDSGPHTVVDVDLTVPADHSVSVLAKASEGHGDTAFPEERCGERFHSAEAEWRRPPGWRGHVPPWQCAAGAPLVLHRSVVADDHTRAISGFETTGLAPDGEWTLIRVVW